MKNSYKLALLAALGMATATAAQAYTSGDLLVCVYQSGIANTETLDIGSLTTLEGEGSVSLSSALSSAGFNTTLSSSAVFGVYGAVTAGNGSVNHNTFLSVDGTLNEVPSAINNYTAFGTIKAPIVTLGNNLGLQAVGSGTDFSSSLTVGGGGLTDALSYNPSTVVSDTANLYTIADNGAAPVLDGTLTLNASTETLTFEGTSVPEPTTYGLIAGAGLLIVSLRNKFSRKQA